MDDALRSFYCKAEADPQHFLYFFPEPHAHGTLGFCFFAGFLPAVFGFGFGFGFLPAVFGFSGSGPGNGRTACMTFRTCFIVKSAFFNRKSGFLVANRNLSIGN